MCMSWPHQHPPSTARACLPRACPPRPTGRLRTDPGTATAPPCGGTVTEEVSMIGTSRRSPAKAREKAALLVVLGDGS
ncbi:hypothetical protein SCANM63S_07255 [Streptomyces canarius]